MKPYKESFKLQEEKLKSNEVLTVKTDGMNRKNVKVKVLDFVKTMGDTDYYFVEYPKNFMDILFVDNEENTMNVSPEIGFSEAIDMTEDEILDKAKSYKLKVNNRFM